MEKILVIAAHPDDEVLGLGGTIAKKVAQGAEVALLIVTDGSTSQYASSENLGEIIENKKKETADCAGLLGISKIYYGNLPDMKLDAVSHTEINAVIEKVVDDFCPTVIYTHFRGDVNRDHTCVYESTLVSSRPVPGQCVKKIFMYSVPSSTEWNAQFCDTAFVPNWYEDISDYAEVKYNAFSCYRTEMRQYPHPRSVEYLRAADKIEGLKVGLSVAESFVLVRCID